MLRFFTPLQYSQYMEEVLAVYPDLNMDDLIATTNAWITKSIGTNVWKVKA